MLDKPLQRSSTLLCPLLLPPKYTFGRSSRISMSSNATGARPRSREAKKIACKVYSFRAATVVQPATAFAALINFVLYYCWVPGVIGR